MARSPAPARDRILAAFAGLLESDGERAATLEAVAAAAGISKGGLLYHFGSKEALVEGLIEWFENAVADDLTLMRAAPAGVVDYFIRTAVATGSALDQSAIALIRLAQGHDPQARAALQRAQETWFATVLDAVGDPVVARCVMLLSDGLYYNSALSDAEGTTLPSGDELDAIIEAIARLRTGPAGES